MADFRNAGRELRPKGQPEAVRVHDFKIPERGRAATYGVYDIGANAGWVSVGTDHDTAHYPAGVTLSDKELAALNPTPHEFNGAWNYTFAPKPNGQKRLFINSP